MEPKTVSVSEFKATCLRLFEEIRQTGQPIIVTRRGEPIAQVGPPPKAGRGDGWLGCLRGTGQVLGDLVSPVLEHEAWETPVLAEWDELSATDDQEPE
jgi:antitoxin (DNA-binding transcriptional repressor) of toxin-antitoxin stability system